MVKNKMGFGIGSYPKMIPKLALRYFEWAIIYPLPKYRFSIRNLETVYYENQIRFPCLFFGVITF